MMELMLPLCLLAGSGFVLLASIGVFRFADAYQRMHAATKAGAFGGAILALGAGFHFTTPRVWIEVVLMMVFFYSTMPVAAHLIARAANRAGVMPTRDTDTSELECFGRAYDNPVIRNDNNETHENARKDDHSKANTSPPEK
jgi:multicomponent Na+:H+ antiporter subunit G